MGSAFNEQLLCPYLTNSLLFEGKRKLYFRQGYLSGIWGKICISKGIGKYEILGISRMLLLYTSF